MSGNMRREARTSLMGTAALLLLLAYVMNFSGVAAATPQTRKQEQSFSETFRSPSFSLAPGDVVDKFFRVSMPQGHIALRSMDAQVVDENGKPIPLHDTYLHHWTFHRFHIAHGSTTGVFDGLNETHTTMVRNAGVCQDRTLGQMYGLGSETRRTNTTVPPPYGIVVGDPQSVPAGFEEVWILNLHAIDTRGALDALRCTECLCELYNRTTYHDGSELPAEYKGGLQCCFDETHCAVHSGFEGSKRKLFLEYTVSWVDMTEDVVPARVYILDVTDKGNPLGQEPQCRVEYTVNKCEEGSTQCIDAEQSVALLPEGGDVIYGVAHQHSGGLGSVLHNQDGVEICSSIPIYGEGSEAGDESGYIVGMSTCYPEPGTVKIRSGEELRLTSLYSSKQRHTGVMCLFYLLVAEPRSPPVKVHVETTMAIADVKVVLPIVAVALAIAVGLAIWRFRKSRRGRGPEYQII